MEWGEDSRTERRPLRFGAYFINFHIQNPCGKCSSRRAVWVEMKQPKKSVSCLHVNKIGMFEQRMAATLVSSSLGSGISECDFEFREQEMDEAEFQRQKQGLGSLLAEAGASLGVSASTSSTGGPVLKTPSLCG